MHFLTKLKFAAMPCLWALQPKTNQKLTMGKTIGLKQLAQKVYTLVEGMPPEWLASIGEIEDAYDGIIYGPSGSGKTNCTVQLIKALMLAMPSVKAEYISYEEGHAKTVQDLMIKRHNMLELVGNRLAISEHLNYAELQKRISRRQSAKIWVIDSIQASGLTYPQIKELKEVYVLSKKKKIILFISWAEGKEPQGSCAKSVKYYANIKMRVENFIMFPVSRYGGNMPYVINEALAKQRWQKQFNKVAMTAHKPKPKPQKNDTDGNIKSEPHSGADAIPSQLDSEENC